MFITKEEALKLVQEKNAYLIDVRTPQEVNENPVPDALNYPLDNLEMLAYENLDSSRPAILFCETGRRSNMGAKILTLNGFQEVHNLGSYKAWLV